MSNQDTAYEVWLIDVSGSMQGSRIELMRQAVSKWQQRAPHVRLLAFATEVREIKSLEDVGEPRGGTNLHLALDRAAELSPGKVVVFTDGEPSDEQACFAAAGRIPGIVDTVFCGDADDRSAIAFCDKLARDNGGRTASRDIAKGYALTCDEVESLLGLPAPVAL
jgi:hypothetical protein